MNDAGVISLRVTGAVKQDGTEFKRIKIGNTRGSEVDAYVCVASAFGTKLKIYRERDAISCC